MGKPPLFLALSPGSLAHSRGGGVRREREPGFSRLRMREIFPESWETVLFWYSSAYGLSITELFGYSSA